MSIAKKTTKKTTTRKKRVLSAAQKAALARGRAKLKAKQKASPARKKTTKAKKTTTAASTKTVVVKAAPKKRKTTVANTGGSGMARAKRSVKRTASRAKRATGNFMRKADTMTMVKNAGLAILGGVGAGFVANKIPIQDKRVKSALPIVAGIVLSGTMGRKNNLIKGVSEGMVILGAVSLFKSLAPNVPFLAGDEPQYYIPAGIPYTPPALVDDSMGGTVRLGETVSLGIDEYYSPSDI